MSDISTLGGTPTLAHLGGTTTLAQWRCAIAVSQCGGFAQAAQQLHKSQSTISHAVNELSQRLGIQLFQKDGRKATLTEAGSALLRRAERLLKDAHALEALAAIMVEGYDAELNVAVDSIVPKSFVIEGLRKFAETAPQTRVSVHETVLSGTHEALLDGTADFAISAVVPLGFVGTPLFQVEFVATTHRDHPLHALKRPIDYDDLRAHRQLVVRDSGKSDYDAGWLEAEQRWSFSTHSASLEAMRAGAGFAWIPRHAIAHDLEQGNLVPLDMKYGATRRADVSLVRRRDSDLAPCRRALVGAFEEMAVAYR